MDPNAAIIPTHSTAENAAAILPAGPVGKNRLSRLTQFVDWLDREGRPWHHPDLAAYRDYLLTRPDEQYKDARGITRTRSALSPRAAAAHLSTVRGRYDELLKDNATRDRLYDLAAARFDDIPARKAFVDEVVTRLQNAIDPKHARVKVEEKQDRADSEHLRLTPAQQKALTNAPGVTTLKGLRDTALIALALATGLREQELCNLDVGDLRQQLGGELALQVRKGKGCKSRLVPYGELDACLAFVDRWLKVAGVAGGRVFRSMDRHGNLRAGITPLAIQQLLGSYPIAVNGETRTVRPHDLRRTYARTQYEQGTPILAIQQNLGHASQQTTLGYIGTLDADTRRARYVDIFPDLAALDNAPAVQQPLPDLAGDQDQGDDLPPGARLVADQVAKRGTDERAAAARLENWLLQS